MLRDVLGSPGCAKTAHVSKRSLKTRAIVLSDTRKTVSEVLHSRQWFSQGAIDLGAITPNVVSTPMRNSLILGPPRVARRPSASRM